MCVCVCVCVCVCMEEWSIRQCLAPNTINGADIEIQSSLRMSLKLVSLGVLSNSSVKVRGVSEEPSAFIFADEEPGSFKLRDGDITFL